MNIFISKKKFEFLTNNFVKLKKFRFVYVISVRTNFQQKKFNGLDESRTCISYYFKIKKNGFIRHIYI